MKGLHMFGNLQPSAEIHSHIDDPELLVILDFFNIKEDELPKPIPGPMEAFWPVGVLHRAESYQNATIAKLRFACGDDGMMIFFVWFKQKEAEKNIPLFIKQLTRIATSSYLGIIWVDDETKIVRQVTDFLQLADWKTLYESGKALPIRKINMDTPLFIS